MTTRCKAMTSACVLLLVLAISQPAHAAVRLVKLDAVELVKNNREVEGDEKHVIERDGFTYRFASAENRKVFEADPARYELQMGGACARMGSLSGSANPDLFAVHDGRLYIFASKQCRAAFLAAPEKFIDRDDPPIKADAASTKRGRELLNMALKAHGGAAAIDAVKTYRQIRETVVTQAGAKYDYKYTTTIAYPDRVRDEFCWNDNCSAQTVVGSRGADWTSSGFDKALAAVQVRAVKRKVAANLLSILKARGRGDCIIARVGEDTVGDTKIERVGLSIDGWTWILGIDPHGGRVRTLEYTGRGGDRDVIGRVVLTFVDYQSTDGIMLPTSWTTTFDGKPGKELVTLTKVKVNAAVSEALFNVDAPK